MTPPTLLVPPPAPAAPRQVEALEQEDLAHYDPSEEAPRRASAEQRPTGTWATIRRWFDSWDREEAPLEMRGKVDWLRVLPFLSLHGVVFLIPLVGWSWTAVGVALALYAVRMFAITAFYHRYFSHRTFKTSRAMQFVFAMIGNSAVQRGPLWWAAHHREHHANSDGPLDAHSPIQRGFWWSHIGWITDRTNFATRLHRVRDLARFPELCFLDRFDVLVPVAGAALMYGLGEIVGALFPASGTSGVQLLVWSILSTVVLFHATFTINSLSHLFGTRPYETKDHSRNNVWLALITFGEGWHNNHHHYSASVRQGFRWYEIDMSWWGLVVLRSLGLVWDLRPVPARVVAQRRPRARR